MENYNPTQRVYKNVFNGLLYSLYKNDITDDIFLYNVDNDSRISQFYASAIDGVDYKFSDGSIITLNAGDFFTPYNTVGNPIAKRYSAIEKRFKKF